MKRFDRAIRVINDEMLRMAGKAAQDFVEHGRIELALETKEVECLKEAILILKEHHRNKFV